MVTHNMQQAARISDQDAFFLWERLVEYGETRTDVFNPGRKKDRGLYHRTVRMSGGLHMREKFNEQLQLLHEKTD
jgi:ABC-type phosphate transport system ATPase subunit